MADTSPFALRDVVRSWCEQLPAGAPADQVVALAQALLDASPEVQALPEAAKVAEPITRLPQRPAAAAGRTKPATRPGTCWSWRRAWSPRPRHAWAGASASSGRPRSTRRWLPARR